MIIGVSVLIFWLVAWSILWPFAAFFRVADFSTPWGVVDEVLAAMCIALIFSVLPLLIVLMLWQRVLAPELLNCAPTYWTMWC